MPCSAQARLLSRLAESWPQSLAWRVLVYAPQVYAVSAAARRQPVSRVLPQVSLLPETWQARALFEQAIQSQAAV